MPSKTLKEDLSRFGLWKVAFKSIKLRTGAPLNLAENFITQPIDKILLQMQLQYAQELHDYDVQLHI